MFKHVALRPCSESKSFDLTEEILNNLILLVERHALKSAAENATLISTLMGMLEVKDSLLKINKKVRADFYNPRHQDKLSELESMWENWLDTVKYQQLNDRYEISGHLSQPIGKGSYSSIFKHGERAIKATYYRNFNEEQPSFHIGEALNVMIRSFTEVRFGRMLATSKLRVTLPSQITFNGGYAISPLALKDGSFDQVIDSTLSQERMLPIYFEAIQTSAILWKRYHIFFTDFKLENILVQKRECSEEIKAYLCDFGSSFKAEDNRELIAEFINDNSTRLPEQDWLTQGIKSKSLGSDLLKDALSAAAVYMYGLNGLRAINRIVGNPPSFNPNYLVMDYYMQHPLEINEPIDLQKITSHWAPISHITPLSLFLTHAYPKMRGTEKILSLMAYAVSESPKERPKMSVYIEQFSDELNRLSQKADSPNENSCLDSQILRPTPIRAESRPCL